MKIIYLDLPITEQVIKWMDAIKTDDVIFILNSTQIITDLSLGMADCSILCLSDKDYLESVACPENELGNHVYIFHPFVRRNLHLQTEKNINLLNQFSDQNTTFYLMFSPDYSEIAFK